MDSPKKKRATARSRNKIPPWRRNVGPVISLLRDRDRIRIDFEYSPDRVKAIKAIPAARFHPDDKSWSIPITELERLLALKDIPQNGILNGLAQRDVKPINFSDARTEIASDPFAVREEALAAYLVDLVVRFHAEKRRIRIIPRVNSAAHKILGRMPGAIYSSFDSAYTLPTEEIPELLKKLRDRKVLFAVAADAGGVLSASSSLRREILANPNNSNGDSLSQALLTPFITKLHYPEVGFRPCFFTSEQFKLAFPGVKREPGRVFVLDDRGLLSFVGRMRALPFTVWFTKEVHDFISASRDRLGEQLAAGGGVLDDMAADLIAAPLIWRTAESGRGILTVALAVDSQARDLIVSRLSELLSCDYSSDMAVLQIEVPDSKLLSVLGEVEHLSEVYGVPRASRSSSFDKLVRDVKERAKLLERAHFYGALDDVEARDVHGLEPQQAERLFPHQRVAVQWLKENPYAFLGDDMGLGKTLSVLSYFKAIRQIDAFKLLVVICPNSLVRNWAREAKMWFPELKSCVLTGDKSEKSWALRMLNEGALEVELVVLNYEGVRLDYVTPALEKLISSRKTLLCLDESQRVKNPSAKTFKALSQIAPCSDRRVFLSGTPTPKDVSDLWAQMRLLDGGERFGKSFYKWLGRVAELGNEYSEFAVRRFHDAEVAESIHRAHEIMLRRRKERVVNLPPKTFSIREIELSGSQAERYNEIREGLILRMRSTSGEQFTREITNILEEYLRAVQVASNPRLIDPQWKGEPAKFLELDEIVRELVHEQGQKLVVWTNYLGNVAELCERYKGYGAHPFSGEVSAADRERTVRAFQEDEAPKILVAVPAAGGVGITLTAAQTAVYIDKTWNAEHWMQSVDRLHRIGQRGTVNIISFLGCKVDEIIHWNLRRKEQGQAKVLGDYGQAKQGEEGLAIRGGVTRGELMEALE